MKKKKKERQRKKERTGNFIEEIEINDSKWGCKDERDETVTRDSSVNRN